MVDLNGNAYSRTQNAFRYRKEYVKECRCKPEPWSDEAKQDYARRESGDPAPGEVKTAEVEEKETAAVMTAAGSYSDRRAPRGGSRSARRKRNRSNNASGYDGQWWAGSW